MPTLDNHQSSEYTKPRKIYGTLFERFRNYCGPKHPITGCIPWLASTNKQGYGQIMNDNEFGRRPLLAHRVAWEEAGLTLVDSLEILHTCNNPICVNVEHLEQGTHKENMEMAALACVMGRPRQFSDADYAYIYREVDKGRSKTVIAQEIGCSKQLVSKLLAKRRTVNANS